MNLDLSGTVVGRVTRAGLLGDLMFSSWLL